MKLQPAKVIKYLRKQIPSFECKSGCHACCGPIPFSKWEWTQIKDKRKAVSLNCPYITEEGCAIYSQRPILCRLFGVVPEMLCPFGYRPTKLLSSKKGKELMDLYSKIMGV